MSNSKQNQSQTTNQANETVTKRSLMQTPLPWLTLAVIAAVGGFLFAKNSGLVNSEPVANSVQAKLQNSIYLPETFKSVPEFSMLDKNAAEVSNDVLKGQWNLLFFGFTHCPDVCPTTLATVDRAITQIAEMDSSLPVPDVFFVSVDPKRDTPDLLKNYVEFFNPNFHALSGTMNQMYSLINPLSIVVGYTVDEDDPTQYTVDHTASIMLVDPQLRVRGKFNAPHKANEIAEDYQTLIKALL